MSELNQVPSAAYEDPDDLPSSPEERLELTQRMRHKLVNALTEDGRRIPTDPDGAKLVLLALNDMDRTTLGAMKQKGEDSRSAADQLVAQALLTLGNRIGSNKVLREDAPVAHRVPQVDDSLLPEIEVVPGEMDVGTQSITYQDLATQFSRSRTEALPAPGE